MVGWGRGKTNSIKWSRKNVWHKVHPRVRFGGMGFKCFQSMLPIVSKIRYQAFFFFDTNMKECPTRCFQTKLFMTHNFTPLTPNIRNSPNVLLKDTLFPLLKKCIKFIFHNFIKYEQSFESVSAFQRDHDFRSQ